MSMHRVAPAGLMLAAGVLITMVAIVFARLAYGLVLPGMRSALGLSYRDAANLATASALGYLILVMAAGTLAARRGARFSVVLGLLLLTAGFAGMALSSQYALLLVFMILLGFGTAFCYTPSVSLLAALFPDRRGAVIGWMSSGVGIGMMLVGLLVPRLNDAMGTDGWRWVWGSFGSISALTVIAVLALLPSTPGHGSTGGSLVSARASAVYTNRRVILVGLLYGITGMIYIMQATFMYSFALESGLTPATAGSLAAMMGMLSIPAGPFWGALSDRVGRGRTLVTTMAVALVAILLPVAQPSFWSFAFHYVALGMTLAGLFTGILATATEQVEARQAPLAVSYVTFFFAAGQLLGPVLTGLVVDRTGSFRVAFGGSCALLLVGCYLTLKIRRFAPGGRAKTSVTAELGKENRG